MLYFNTNLGATPTWGIPETPARGLSRNGVKNYSKGPCVTILE